MQSNDISASARKSAGSARFARATVCATVFGLLLRLYHYARNPSMWHDEAATSVNILRKSFAGLFGHLDHSATGPSLLLCMQKCVVLVLGDSTYSLRLISFLASCVALLLLVRLSKSLLDPAAVLCVTLIGACSDHLLWHASEARHYSSDFLFAAALLLLFVKTASRSLERRLLLFAAFTPFAILLSYPGIFLCGGLMLALLVEMRENRRASAWAGWVLLGIWITALFAFFYFFTIRPQRSSEMDAAWANAFPDLHRPWKLPYWAVSKTVGIFDYFVRPSLGGLLIFPAIVGSIVFWKDDKKRPLVILTLAPMAFALLLALVKSYPYTGARTMVYSLPGLAILMGAGLAPTFRWLKTRLPALVASIAVGILFFPVGGALVLSLYRVAVPWPRTDAAGASAYVLANRLPADPVTGNHWEYEYYFRNLGGAYFPDLTFFQSPEAARTGRVWLVLTSGAPADRLKIAAGIIGNGWTAAGVHEFENTTVFLLFRTARN